METKRFYNFPMKLDNNHKSILIIVGLFLLFIGLRLLFLTADPPSAISIGTVWLDEGGWTHNARNKVLFDEWRLDEFNPMFFSPIFTYLEYLSFKAFGVGTFQARLVSVVFGCLSLLFFYATMRISFNRIIALSAFFFMGTNYIFLMHNRIAMADTTLIFFMVLTLFFFQKSEERLYYSIFSGISCMLAFVTKASGGFFLAVPILTLIIIWLQNADNSEIKKRVKYRFLFFLSGLFMLAAVWLVFWVLPNLQDYWFYNIGIQTRIRLNDMTLWTFIKEHVIHIFGFSIFHTFFGRMPIISIAAFIAILVLWGEFATSFKKTHPLDIFFLTWFLLAALEIIFISAVQHRYLFFIPPLIGLGTHLLGKHDSIEILGRLLTLKSVNKIFSFLVLLYVLYLIYGSLGRLFIPYPEVRLKILASFSLGMSILSGFILIRKGESLLNRMRNIKTGYNLFFTLLVFSLVINLGQYAHWVIRKDYTYYRASKQLGNILKPSTPVQGDAAIALSLENKIKPIFIGDGWSNDRDVLKRDDVEHILVFPDLRFNNNIQKLLLAYHDATKIAEFELYDAFPPDGAKRAILLKKRK